MVNKPHAPRNTSKGGKKAPIAGLNGEDTSFIVFGSEKGNKKAQPAPSSSSSNKGKGKDATDATGTIPEAEKKPDARTIIAGSSWTGKLPVTLFNELCQKAKYERPEYVTRRNAKGHTCEVVLRQKNPKTQEITTLPPIAPPRSYQQEQGAQPSALEAKHFGATYALYRLRNATNLHTTLPPQYRGYWKGDFAELKKEAIAQGRAYEYEADPFLAFKQRQDAIAAADKAKADRIKQQQEADKKPQITDVDGRIQDKHALRGWTRVPKVEMGGKTRSKVEQLIRSADLWNIHGVKLDQKQQQMIVQSLENSGFRKSHVAEAASICKDKEECLEWLLIHVPEDDLPAWSLPENYTAGVTLASSDLKREGQLKRLAVAGYAKDLCGEALDMAHGDENVAAGVLQARLMDEDTMTLVQSPASSEWEEELSTIQAIFGDRSKVQGNVCTITLELLTSNKKPILLHVRPSPSYPNNAPVLAIEADLPAYIRLSILKQCIEYANTAFLGEQMIFNILDWLENEIVSIVDSPGRLSDVANAVSRDVKQKLQKSSKAGHRRHPQPIVWTANTKKSQDLLSAFSAKQETFEQQRMLQARQNLPAWKVQDTVVDCVTKNQVTIISGETGSGKSTQSVQFILDDLIKRGYGDCANIICTQPRRISALGLADRIADERCGKVGDEVGYAIRGEARQRHGLTKITFVTTGVLLRRLQTSGGSTDDVARSLADVSHVVIDEVHERSLDTDFLLILLRDVLKQRKDLKLVLMSATLDASTFEKYFLSTCTVGKVEIAGRTHPVTDIYLDEILRATGFGGLDIVNSANDEQEEQSIGKALRAVGPRINYELIAETVRCIDGDLGNEQGGILIFLPGVAEIDRTLRALRNDSNLHVLPLHASLQNSEQRRVFQKAPEGKRKVVAATNVAETSITIEDIVAVIDTGKVKETSFSPENKMVILAEVWAPKAACKQRRGRAGRVRAGKCYKLFTQAVEAKMAERPDPEIRRVPLEQMCLSVRAMGIIDVASFLASALTPPETTAVGGALTVLRRMGALDGQDLTALGRHCAMIPADLRCAKLMVYGAAFGCLEACATIAAILTTRSPFISPKEKREESKAARLSFGGNAGDLLCDFRAYEQWSEKRSELPSGAQRRWCDENFLGMHTLLDISTNRKQFMASMKEIGFEAGQRASADVPSNTDENLLRALIAGAFQPQIARIAFPDKKYAASSSGAIEMDPEARTIKFFDEDDSRVFIHPTSTLFEAQTYPNDSKYMSYFNKMATSKIFIRDLTPFNIYSLLLFSGPITIDPQGRGLIVDGWLRVRGWARIGVLVSRLRMMFDELLAQKIDDPAMELSRNPISMCVRRLIELNGLDR